MAVAVAVRNKAPSATSTDMILLPVIDCGGADSRSAVLAAMPRAMPRGLRAIWTSGTRPAERSASAISTSAPGSSGSNGERTVACSRMPRATRPCLSATRSFHVRAAVIDGARHRQQPVVDRARLRVVLRLAGSDQLDERLGCETAVADQGAVHVEHRVQQIFVVAGEDLQIRDAHDGRRESRVSQRRMLRTPFFMAKTPGSAAMSSWVSRL